MSSAPFRSKASPFVSPSIPIGLLKTVVQVLGPEPGFPWPSAVPMARPAASVSATIGRAILQVVLFRPPSS
ncbi:MAG: hypothetical protein ACRDNR_00115 [Gaiellaceae bacterium]